MAEDEDVGVVVGGVEAEEGGAGVGNEVLQGAEVEGSDFELSSEDGVALTELLPEALFFGV